MGIERWDLDTEGIYMKPNKTRSFDFFLPRVGEFLTMKWHPQNSPQGITLAKVLTMNLKEKLGGQLFLR